MGGTEADRPIDDDVGAVDELELDDELRGPEPNNDRDESEDDYGRVLGTVNRIGEFGVGAVSKVGDPIVERVAARYDTEAEPPVLAELVDGSEVLFIDRMARRKSLYEYDLVVLVSPQYPEPAIIKNDEPIEVAKGSVLCPADELRALSIGGKRVRVRPTILVEPDRADSVRWDHRVELPAALDGVTIPKRELQADEFYRAVLKGAENS